MEIFKIEEFIKKESPNPGERFVQQLLTREKKAKNIGGILVVLPAGGKTPYHFHNKRESVIIPISGEATEIFEGKEIQIKPNDVLYIPPIEKHGMINRTDKDFRYLEFFTADAGGVLDFIEVTGE